MSKVKVQDLFKEPKVLDDLKHNDLESVYDYWTSLNVNDSMKNPILTRFLMQAGINPLDYMKDNIKEWCFASSSTSQDTDPWNKESDIFIDTKNIGEFAFRGNKFRHLTLGPRTQVIGDCAFCWCIELNQLTVKGNNLIYILDGSFDSTNLSEVTLPSSICYIDENAFDVGVIVKVPQSAGINWDANYRFTIKAI